MSKKKSRIAYHFVVVGCGGTGSVFMEKFTRYLSCRNNKDISEIIIIDGDVVEEKNLRNQSFIKEDVGMYKSSVWENICNGFLKEDDLCRAYGIYIQKESDLASKISRSSYYYEAVEDVVVLIGCCDNHACRLIMEQFFADKKYENILYFDSANEFDYGETVFAAKLQNKVVSQPRSVLFPDILKGDLRKRSELSCEELNSVEPQHMLINQLAAMQLMMGVVKVLEKKEIPTGVTYFNTNFSTQHYPSDPKRKVG